MEKPLTARIQPDGMPLDVTGYERAGGYQALRKALTMTPDAIIDEVKRAKLRGRGGGGLPDRAQMGGGAERRRCATPALSHRQRR